MANQTSVVDVATHHMQKAFNVWLENSSVKYATNLANSHQYVSRKAKANTLLIPFMQGNRKHNNYMRGPFTPSMMQRAVNESGPEDTFCLQMKIHRTCISHLEVPKLVYLMANLAYCLQEYHTRNQYLWARLDTCTDVNLMPMAVYCLMFKDPQLKNSLLPTWRLKPTPLRS